MTNLKKLITATRPNSAVAESYTTFRTNLNYMNVDSINQVILFTSSLSGEGKSTTISNVAVEFASHGEKTLLIECDLRRAKIHDFFSITQSPGLMNILVEDYKLSDVVTSIDGVDNLDVLTAGPLPPAPSEIVSSKKLRDIIKEARDSYDKILIDAPPILVVADALILSNIVDSVVVIVASNSTKKDAFTKAIKQMRQVEANILGVVLTKASGKRNSYYGDNAYYGEKEKKMFKSSKSRKKLDYLDDNKNG